MMPTFAAFVDDTGVLALADRVGFRQAVQKLSGRDVLVTIKAKPRPQGTQAMRYYRGVVVPDVAKASGVADPDDYESVHDALAWKFLRIADDPHFGTPRRRSTAKDDLSSEEMSDYISQVILWAETSIPGCRIRRANEVDDESIVDPGWR